MASNPARSRSTAPLATLALAALLGALVLTAASGAPAGADARSTKQAQATTVHLVSRAAFHDRMRKLWEDHVTWTRLAIVTFADGSPGFDATAARLLRNQADIGRAVVPFYGAPAGARLSALLHDHITIAVALLQAAKTGDSAAFGAARSRWYANADDIAGFLATANPRFWPRRVMRADMRTHLDQTLAEAAAELHGDYPASVRAYDAIHRHILDMADMLSSGITKQFPRRFR